MRSPRPRNRKCGRFAARERENLPVTLLPPLVSTTNRSLGGGKRRGNKRGWREMENRENHPVLNPGNMGGPMCTPSHWSLSEGGPPSGMGPPRLNPALLLSLVYTFLITTIEVSSHFVYEAYIALRLKKSYNISFTTAPYPSYSLPIPTLTEYNWVGKPHRPPWPTRNLALIEQHQVSPLYCFYNLPRSPKCGRPTYL